MKLLFKVVLAVVLLSWASSAVSRALPVLGSGLPQETYRSCADLRRDYPSGLAATQGAAQTVSGRPLPRVFPAAYVLNPDLDRDRDGVACPAKPR